MSETCPACGVVKLAEDCYKFSSGQVVNAETVKGRVCQYAKESGCINNSASFDTSIDYWKKVLGKTTPPSG